MTRRIRYDAWSGADAWRSGVLRGTTVRDDGTLTVTAEPHGTQDGYDYGLWGSPMPAVGFRFTELVASWSAQTPPGSWIEVRVVASRPDRSGPDHPRQDDHVLAAWSSGDLPERRTGDPDDDPEIEVDVWRPVGGADTYGLLVRLLHRPGQPGPTLRRLGAVVSVGEPRSDTSALLHVVQCILDVPRLSQMAFAEVGGRGWCSPTAVSMVLAHAGRLPLGTDTQPSDLRAAARATFDPAHDGTGNWSFNTAWAAGLAGHAFVTRLHDLRDAEAFIATGIPLVVSLAYGAGELTGAPIPSTDGHLLVICGFTETGDVVVNDPAAPTAASVRRTYDRAELERAWLGGSGGTVYVIHRDDQPLPPREGGGAW